MYSKIMARILSIVFVFATMSVSGKAFQETACANEGGMCKNVGDGCNGKLLSGKCPKQTSNVKCCVEEAGSVKQETACSNAGGMCKKVSGGCSGQFLSGKCPTQSSDVKCCVEGSGGGGNCNSGDKYEITLSKVFNHEGKCQNAATDKKGNMFQGKMGYTCMGITPETGYRSRGKFPDCAGFPGEPVDFVKWCYDRNTENFKTGASIIYKTEYFNICDHLEQPAFYVCSDISVNHGQGRAKEYMNELGQADSDMKSYAKQLNEMSRKSYKKKGGSNLQGWLNRADARDRYIDSC